MRKLLTTLSLTTLIGSGAVIPSINSYHQYEKSQKVEKNWKIEQITLPEDKKKSVNNAGDYKKDNTLNKKINWQFVLNNYETILNNNLSDSSRKELISISKNQKQNLSVGYKNMPFDGINKVYPGFFITTVYISENLLSFIMQQIINYRHYEHEKIVETIAAALLVVGFRISGLVIGAIAGILYTYFEIISAADEGQGVGFYLFIQVILGGVWAQ